MLRSKSAALLVGASALAMASSAFAQEVAAPAAEELEAIVVTGSRLATAGFNAPTPVTVVGAAAIERASPATLGESLQELPVFRNGVGPTAVTNGVVAANQASMDLRALGAARTLTLVNGRRIVPVNASGTFDTNLLPSTLIESVDVVTGGASAAYGSDAVAGVVNFNLRNNLEGFRGQVRYGITERGDNEEPSLALAWGSSFAGGRGHIILGGELNKASGVETMFDRDWGQREPGELALGNTRASNLPNTIVGEYVELYLYQPGGFISAGPLAGTAFDANGRPFTPPLSPVRGNQEMISAGPGSVLYGNTEYSTMVLRGEYERSAFAGRVEYDINEATKMFAEFNYGELYTYNNSGTCCKNQTFRINRDNPFLPADTVARMIATNTTQIQVNRRGEYAGLKSGNKTKMRNMVFGVEGSVFGDWDWDAYFQNGHTYQFTSLTNTPRTADLHAAAYAVRDPSGNIVCGPAATNPFYLAISDLELRRRTIANVSPGCVPYNAIGVDAASNAAAVRYFQGSSDQDNWIDRTVAAVNLRGSPLELPAGPLALAVGAEWRKDKVEARGCPDCLADKLINQNYKSYSGEVNVKEAFAEVGVPVIRDQTFFRSLDLNGAVRRTDYSLSGGVTTWKLGATWEPSSMFRLRATRSRDIRAPNLSELYNPGGSGRSNVTNRRTGASGIVDSTTAGNPNLVPEIADTFTGGIVFQPEWDWAWGLRMSVDYYDIAVDGVIDSVSAQETLDRFLVQGRTEYAPFIFFDPNIPFGIARVNGIQENQSQRVIRGIDFEASARAPIDAMGLPGNLTMRALVTYAMENLTISNDGISSDAAGVAAPYVQGNFSFNYDLNRFSAGLTALYKSSIRRSATLVGPDSPLYNAVLIPGTEAGPCGRMLVNNVATGNCTKNNTINQNVFPSSVYFNLSLAYDIIAAPGRRLQAFGYVENLLDKDPDVVSVSILGSSPYNTVGRNYRVGLRFEF